MQDVAELAVRDESRFIGFDTVIAFVEKLDYNAKHKQGTSVVIYADEAARTLYNELVAGKYITIADDDSWSFTLKGASFMQGLVKWARQTPEQLPNKKDTLAHLLMGFFLGHNIANKPNLAYVSTGEPITVELLSSQYISFYDACDDVPAYANEVVDDSTVIEPFQHDNINNCVFTSILTFNLSKMYNTKQGLYAENMIDVQIDIEEFYDHLKDEESDLSFKQVGFALSMLV